MKSSTRSIRRIVKIRIFGMMTLLVILVLVMTLREESVVRALHEKESSSFSFHLLHTDDLHSHIEGNGPDSSLTDGSVENGNNQVIGHYARLLTLIKKMKRTFSNVLLLGKFY